MALRVLHSYNARYTKEVEVIKNLNHPFIVQFFDVYISDNVAFIEMELMHSTLRELTKSKNLEQSDQKLVFYQVCLALQFLHSNKICHRDLKAANILTTLDKDFIVTKLSDFGISSVNGNEMETQFVGTKGYVLYFYKKIK